MRWCIIMLSPAQCFGYTFVVQCPRLEMNEHIKQMHHSTRTEDRNECTDTYSAAEQPADQCNEGKQQYLNHTYGYLRQPFPDCYE